MAKKKEDCPKGLILRGLGHATVDGQMSQKSLHVWLAHFLGMNPSAYAIMMKTQKFLDPAFIGRDGSRRQSPDFACGFVLIQELHTSILLRKICSINSRLSLS